MTTGDVVLHPQRLAIVRALSGHPRTTKQLAEALPAIPSATLYRHLALLLDAGVISVVAERRVRGAAERTYGLGANAVLTQEALADATLEDHFRYFATFLGGLLDDYGQYLQRGRIDLAADGVGYHQQLLELTDEEFVQLLTDLRSVIERYRANEPSPERTARLLATITMPVTNQTGATP